MSASEFSACLLLAFSTLSSLSNCFRYLKASLSSLADSIWSTLRFTLPAESSEEALLSLLLLDSSSRSSADVWLLVEGIGSMSGSSTVWVDSLLTCGAGIGVVGAGGNATLCGGV